MYFHFIILISIIKINLVIQSYEFVKSDQNQKNFNVNSF